MAHDVLSYALELVIYALDSVSYALDLVKHALDLVIYALDSIIYGLDPVNHAFHLVAWREAASFPQLPWTDLAILGLNNVSWPNDALLGMLMATHNFKGFKPPKKPKK